MSNAPTKSTLPGPSTAPVKAPAQTNPVRMGVLLALLAVVVVMLLHHFFVAKPATEKAYQDIQDLFDKRNARGVVAENATEGGKIDAKLVQPKDVQELLSKKPWSTQTEKDYTVETYWWYGMPHQNYIRILYYGSGDNLRFNTHYQNGPVPPEDLPNAIAHEAPPKNGTAPPTTDSDTPSKSGTPANDGEGEKPTTDAPPGPPGPAAPAKPTTDAPADKPAEPAEEKK